MIVTSEFEAPAWASNRHVQTIWPRFFIKKPCLSLNWEKLALPDGDFIELAWNQKVEDAHGLVVIFHGLEGSVDSHYAAHLLSDLGLSGWDAVLVHFRGCGPGGNQSARSYHSGETADNLFALHHLHAQYSYKHLITIGFSLGANMLLKMLGEGYRGPKITQAIAISPPFDLAKCSTAISTGFSKVYEKHLLKSMCQKFIGKNQRYDYQNLIGITEAQIPKLNSFFEFDDKITGPLHGFDGAQHYYQSCSANQYMQNIETPTLVLHAKDDPFMSEDIVPDNSSLSCAVTIELSNNGGHVGFLQGSPWKPELWLNKRIVKCLSKIQE